MSSKRVLLTIGALLAFAVALSFATAAARQTSGDAVPSMPTTSAALSPDRRVRKRASGSLLRQRICRRNSARPSSPTIAGDTCFRICRRRITACGCAVTDSSIRRRSGRRRARPSTSRRSLRPNARSAAQYYPAGYWFSLLQPPGENRIPRHRSTRQRHLAEHPKARPTGSARRSPAAALACHQLGNKATREIPKALGTLRIRVPTRGNAACSQGRRVRRCSAA